MNPDNLKGRLRDIPIPSDLSRRSRIGIEQAISERQAGRRRKSKRLKRIAGTMAAALALIFLSAALANPNAVWAAVQKALQFVPGIGIVKEDDSTSERYVLQKPITLSIGEGTVAITGMLSDEEMTYITMTGEGTPRFDHVTLVNDQGIEYNISSSTASWGSREWTSGFWHPGKLEVGESIQLIIDSEPKTVVPITLTKAPTYSSYPEMGETAAKNGVSITAIPDRVGEKARVSLVARHSDDYIISDYGIHGVYMHDESLKLNVMDDSGRKLGIENIRGVSSPASEFYYELSDSGRGGYTLTLPEISVEYKSEASIEISTQAQANMYQTFDIAGFPVTITRTERVRENGLRVYLDFHYDEKATSSLYKFDLDRLSSSAKLNERTGAMEYMEFEVEPGSKQVNLKLVRPGVVIRGPWQFELSADDFKDIK